MFEYREIFFKKVAASADTFIKSDMDVRNGFQTCVARLSVKRCKTEGEIDSVVWDE